MLGSRGAEDIDPLVAAEQLLDAGEAFVEAPPARGDQVDEHGKVVHAGRALRADALLDPLELPDRADAHPAHLGEVAPDRRSLGANTVPDRRGDLLVERSGRWPEETFAHGRDDSLAVGWTRRRSTTTSRRS